MKDKLKKLVAWNNRIVAIFLFLVGVFAFVYSKTQLVFGSFAKPKGGFVPTVFSIGLMFFGGINIIAEFMKKPEVPSKFVGLNWKRFALYTLECFLYVLFLDKVGFLVCTILVLFVMLKQCGTKGIVKPVIISLVTAFFIWAVFKYAMGIYLPTAKWF